MTPWAYLVRAQNISVTQASRYRPQSMLMGTTQAMDLVTEGMCCGGLDGLREKNSSPSKEIHRLFLY